MTMIFNWAKFPQAQALFRLAVLSGKCWRCTEKNGSLLGFSRRKGLSLLLLEEILHQLIGYPTKCTKGMIHPRWWSPNFWINMTDVNQNSGWDGRKQKFHVLLPASHNKLPWFLVDSCQPGVGEAQARFVLVFVICPGVDWSQKRHVLFKANDGNRSPPCPGDFAC